MQLYSGYVGWDCFGIQLDNQTEINAFRFRDEEGGNNARATVGISRADGSQEVTEDLRLTAGLTARSPQTGAEYPVEWHLSLPDLRHRLEAVVRHLEAFEVDPRAESQARRATTAPAAAERRLREGCC